MLENNHFVRSFGRIKSRKLSDHKKFLYSDLLPKYEIVIADKSSRIKASDLKSKNKFKKINLEIGFGFGDFLFENAKNNPDIYFVACETHINGIVNLLAKLELWPLDNIGIFQYDVRHLLNCLEEEIFDKIYILFPDPWPKARHYKRRLININFLHLLAKKMVRKGELIIATDHDAYKSWIITEIINSRIFKWLAKSKKDWQIFPSDWITTKYQRKAEKEGRTSIILHLRKIK